MDVLRQYNGAVVAILEEALAKAREGDIEAVAVLMAATPPHAEEAIVHPWVKYTANARLNKPMESFLGQLAGMVEKMRINNTIPDRPKSSADYVCFNAALWGMSFDFTNWLIEREMERIAEGAPAPLKVGFWFGRDGKVRLSSAYRRRMFENVMRPMLAFVDAVESPEAAQIGRANEFYCTRNICARIKRGEKLPRMWAPDEAVSRMERYEGCVTITLREADEWPHRNSNVEAWLKFANDLKAKGERVVFVRDTAKAYEPPIDGFEDCPAASTDLHMRGALYQLAKMNFFVANGPIMLAVYGHVNYRVFLNLQPDGHAYMADTPRFWREKNGVEPGGQFPWVLPNQLIVWSEDRYEAISASWEDSARREQSAAA